MASAFLEKEYYITNGGFNDPILKNLQCIEQAYYLILKNAFNNPGESYHFLDDINMLVIAGKNDRVKDLYINRTRLNKRFFRLKQKKARGLKALVLLEKDLDAGEMVLVQTVPNLLAFYHNYDPAFDIKDFKPHHYFLVLHHDAEHIHYVDEPNVIIEKNFIPYAPNPQIGLYKKENLLLPFDHYCQLATIRRNDPPGFSMEKYLRRQLRIMITNYKWKPLRLPRMKVLLGRSALEYLKSLCGKNYPLLNTKTDAPSRIDHHDLLLWKIEVIQKRKNILEQCLSSCLNPGKIVRLITDSQEAWGLFAILISKRYHKGRMEFDPGLIKYLDQIISLEDMLIEELEKAA